MIHYIKGDITKSDCDVICHQVNCQGAMNSGVAKAIREKWPEVYKSYKTWCDRFKEDTYALLGNSQAVAIDHDPRRYVVNLFTQQYYGYDGTRFTDYEAFYNALATLAIQLQDYPNVKIAFPYNIGCCRGGANWNIIRTMIKEVLGDRPVYFYYLNDDDLDDTAKACVLAEKYLTETEGVIV